MISPLQYSGIPKYDYQVSEFLNRSITLLDENVLTYPKSKIMPI